MNKRYLILILIVLILLCVSSLLWYNSGPKPLPTATPRPTSAITPTLPPAKVSSRWPTWSPDGMQLAYVIIEDDIPMLTIKTLETSEQVGIFNGAIDIASPAWSPQGNKIAFSARITEDDNYQLYTIHPDGTQLQRLTHDANGGRLPLWSPDGEKIFYQNATLDDYTIIYSINSDGAGKELITKVYRSGLISLSPDGKWIISISDGTSSINTKNLETGEDASLSDEPDAVLQQPIWSPDGRWIAYTAYTRLRGEIHLIDPVDGMIIQLTDMSQEDRMLAWSPDSKTIAFRRTKDADVSAGDIYLINADGENLRQLTDTPFDEFDCAWSPDGKRIAITLSDPIPPFWDVYIINADGSGMFRLRDDLSYP